MFNRRTTLIAAIVTAVVMLAVLGLAGLAQRSKPPLLRWHTVTLENELEADRLRGGFAWSDYLALEDRLFAELEERVVEPSADEANPAWNRYAPRGVNNPATFPTNWNRSYDLPAGETRGGALLIHGLTDSPYSLRSTAEILNEHGFHVTGLRLPGHGTTPKALREAEVEDWRAAVRAAYQHLVTAVDGRGPVLLVGYSNGGALALDLALDSVDEDGLPIPDRIVLYSPAIGITRAAALARLPGLLNWMPWFSKLGWGSIEPELDPFKYSSFPNEAGYLTHILTTSVRTRLARIERGEQARRFPPVLTFMSLADATVLVEAVVEGLHDRLANSDSELVIFDINRAARMRDLFRTDPVDRLRSLTGRPSTPFRLTVISNIDPATDTLEEWSRPADASEPIVTPLEIQWPRGFYSLSHVAIPFPPDDPIYGYLANPEESFGIPLGRLEPRGEHGLLTLPAGHFNRLRSNPFFPYIEHRLVQVAVKD